MPRRVQILQGSFPARCLAEGERSQPHQGGDESSLGTPWCPCASAGGHNECPWGSTRDGDSVRGKLMVSQQPGDPRDMSAGCTPLPGVGGSIPFGCGVCPARAPLPTPVPKSWGLRGSGHTLGCERPGE